MCRSRWGGGCASQGCQVAQPKGVDLRNPKVGGCASPNNLTRTRHFCETPAAFPFLADSLYLQFLFLLLRTGEVNYGKLSDEMMGSGLVSACPVEGVTAQNLALAGLCAQNTPPPPSNSLRSNQGFWLAWCRPVLGLGKGLGGFISEGSVKSPGGLFAYA